MALVSALIFLSVFKLGLFDSAPEPVVLSTPSPNTENPSDPVVVPGVPRAELPVSALSSAPGGVRYSQFHAVGAASAGSGGGNGGFRAPGTPAPAPDPDCPSCEARRKR